MKKIFKNIKQIFIAIWIFLQEIYYDLWFKLILYRSRNKLRRKLKQIDKNYKKVYEEEINNRNKSGTWTHKIEILHKAVENGNYNQEGFVISTNTDGQVKIRKF